MIISAPILSDEGTEIKLAAEVKSERLGSTGLWFQAPGKYREYLCTDRVDGFLVGLLFPAMQYGEDIHVQGCVSQTLLFNLNNYVIPLLKAFAPSCKSIRVEADQLSAEPLNGSGVGTGFSGGVDSFSTIYDRFELESAPTYQINTLLLLNVGSHGPWTEADRSTGAEHRFRQRYTQLRRYPDEIGLDYIPIDSNLHSFHPWGHQKTHTLTSVAGILIMQKHFSRYYYASTGMNYSSMFSFADDYKDLDVGAYCETVLLPLLSTESIHLVADGYQYTRAQKVSHIAGYEPVRRHLNVCTSPLDGWKNCSQCPKCCRTQMTLDSIGRLKEFGGIFDIERYRKVERSYKSRQVCRAGYDAFAAENVQLARERGNPLPGYVSSRIICAAEDIFKTWGKRVLSPAAYGYLKDLRARGG